MNLNYNHRDCSSNVWSYNWRELVHSCCDLKSVFSFFILISLLSFSNNSFATSAFENFKGSETATNCALEHYSAIGETRCGANDGQILHDPHINAGTVLPYHVEYTFNGRTERHCLLYTSPSPRDRG